jgi:hypothetical protein
MSGYRGHGFRVEQTLGGLPTRLDLEKNYQTNVSTVGQDETPPFGTHDQGGNMLGILDTLAPQPSEQLHSELAPLPRWRGQCTGLSAGNLSVRLRAGGLRSPARLSVPRVPAGCHRNP